MKKTFAYLLLVFVMSFALCGCGRNDVNDNVVVTATPVVTPMVTLDPSPSIMPDVSDGKVNDEDGIIEDKDNGKTDNSTATSSPAPSATTNP